MSAEVGEAALAVLCGIAVAMIVLGAIALLS